MNDFYEQITTLRKKKAGAKLGGEKMSGVENGPLIRMENAADLMSNDRKMARAEKDPVKRQARYLKIVERAKRFTEPEEK